MSLSGKTAVVTGASAGIGWAIAKKLTEAGATVLPVARREDRLNTLSGELGGDAGYLAIDLATTDAAEVLLQKATERLGKVDIIVNNAGILRTSHFEAFDLAELDTMIAVNYAAVVRSSILFARHMRANGSGQIVNISSIGATLVAPANGIYGGLKTALEKFTETLRIELAGSGVRVGIVAPGTTATEIFADMQSKGQQSWAELIPAMEADDIARAVLFMCEQVGNVNAARIHFYSTAEGF